MGFLSCAGGASTGDVATVSGDATKVGETFLLFPFKVLFSPFNNALSCACVSSFSV